MSLIISLRSETLKLKRTLSIYICLLGAAFGPFMSFIEYVDIKASTQRGIEWTEHFMKGREPVCFALLPLYIILVSALLTQLEYRDKTWKQVLASPQRLIDIFLAKFNALQVMILGFLISYIFFLFVTAGIIEILHPDLYEGKLDLYKILKVNAQTYLLNFGMSAIQFWLSLRFRNFIVPLAIGFSLWFLAPILAFQFKASIVELYPYAFSMLGVLKPYSENINTYQWLSVLTAVVFLGIGFIDFRRRKVKS